MIRLDTSVHSNLCEIVTETLRRKNIITIVDFIVEDSLKLAAFSELPHTDIVEIKQHIFKKFGGIKKKAVCLLKTELNNIISTNITNLDTLLKGGLYSGQICELCGLSSSGKTQLCLTIAVNAAIRSDIALWYIDTKKDFSVLRFEEILKARQFVPAIIKETLQRIKVCHIHSFYQLLQALQGLGMLYKTERNVFPVENKRLLVIIDSLPAIIFKVTRDKHNNDHKITYELNDLADACRFLVNECQASVITVNSVTQWNSPNQMGSSGIIPALGKYWSMIPTTRLLLMKLYDETRRISIWKDLRLTENTSCVVIVNDAGIIAK